ncbi:MAG TPA: hypothetical protein VGO52_24365 [Hyphomonadaceae bacterium]|nr:hypothetical protein [Hyphomonadaceae bacterium]
MGKRVLMEGRMKMVMVALAAGLVMGSAAAEPQHPHGAAPKAGGVMGAKAAPLDRADPHVAQLFNLLRQARGQGDKVDMAKLQAALADVGRAHAIEYEIDQAASEEMIMQTAHNAWMAAQAHPENLNSLDAFNKSIGAK